MRPNGHANAELVGAPRDPIRRDAVYADRGQQQGCGGKDDDQREIEPSGLDRRAKDLQKRSKARGDLRGHPADDLADCGERTLGTDACSNDDCEVPPRAQPLAIIYVHRGLSGFFQTSVAHVAHDADHDKQPHIAIHVPELDGAAQRILAGPGGAGHRLADDRHLLRRG